MKSRAELFRGVVINIEKKLLNCSLGIKHFSKRKYGF